MENEELSADKTEKKISSEDGPLTGKVEKKKRTLLHRIINVFLYIGIGLLIIVLVLLGFSQTSTFRNLLREKLIEVADSSLNGKLYVEKIEGTIFTSLYLKNTIVNMGSDTLFKASVIEVKTSPLQLLLKKIYIRKFEIQNAYINLVRDSSGILNLEKLIPPSEEDTTTSEFPFKIQVADFRLTKINFSLQDFNKVKSNEIYTNLTMSDLRVKNLNLNLSALVDVNSNEYSLSIDKLSCSPNISLFNLDNLSGDFFVGEKKLIVKDLNIATERSEFTINAGLDDYNIFDTTGTSDINNALISLELNADKFNFDDLTVFSPSTGILKGSITTDIKVSGAIKEFDLSIDDLTFSNTHLSTKAKILNMLNSDALYITADFHDTEIKQSDINSHIPSLSIPVYEEYGILRFDTLHYEGKPLDFKSNFYLRTDKGNLSAFAKLNMANEVMIYDIAFKTENLDIAPLAGIITSINSTGNAKGKGIKPKNLVAAFNFNVENSVVDGNAVNTLHLKADAENKNIEYDLKLKSDSLSSSITGSIDFTNENNPSYKLNGAFNHLNIEKFMKDTTLITDLNFNVEAEGESFDPEELNLFLNIYLYSSTVNKYTIDSTRAIVDLQREKSGERIINIISDLADITATGNFTLPHTIDLLKNEAAFLSDSFKEKLNQYFPPDTILEGTAASYPLIRKKKIKYFNPLETPINIDYSIDLKNFELISVFLGEKNLEIDGELSGKLISSKDSITATLNSKLEYIKYWGGSDIFFLSNLSLQLNLSNSIASTSSEDIFSNIKLKTDRIFAGSDIHNLFFNFDLKNNTADVDFSVTIEDYASARVFGKADLSGSNVNLNLDTLYLDYKKLSLKNKGRLEISYNKDQIDIRNFILSHNDGDINIKGMLSRTGSQNMKISVSNLSGRDISTNILELKPESSLNGKLSLNADITGNSSSPLIKIDLQMDSINYKNKTFGSLLSKLDYKSKNLNVDIKFLSYLINNQAQALSITGNVPVDLGFEGVKERFIKDKQIDLSLNADNFDLGAFGDILPAVNKLRGYMTADIKLKGTIESLEPNGSIAINNAAFILEANNMEYNAGIKLRVEQETLYMDTLLIENPPGTKNGGRMTGLGNASLNNFEITSSRFWINGDLKVLGPESKSASPSVYGDLAIYTNGNIEFEINEERAFLRAPIVVKVAKLTFPPTASAYQNTSENFKYKFLSDTVKSLKKEMDFESLISLSKQSSRAKETKGSLSSSFDYDITIKVEKEATIVFIISKELNQKLTAVLEGDFQYERVSGRPEVQGELKLLEGSKLEFLKTLEAEGSITFESELTNPYLDITATYINYILPADSSQGSSDEVKVAVKIKIEGPLKELGKNLSQGDDNIAVYVGENNIENNNPDPTKDASDAVMFLLLNKFTDTATQGDNSYVASQAASLAGSIVGGLLNKQFGDVVKNIEIRQAGSQTKFSLVGRAGNFNYSIGGSTDVFQDLSRADVKIEYPLTRRFLIRLERKESISEISITNEMVNEIGLKYRFDF